MDLDFGLGFGTGLWLDNIYNFLKSKDKVYSKKISGTWPMEKMCTVPWSLATHRRLLSLLKLTQNMFAGWEPRLSSEMMEPEAVSNTRTSVPLVLAVATLLPCNQENIVLKHCHFRG